MKILICASEVAPFSKTGGLADVVGALPAEIQEATVFSAAVCTASRCPAAAQAFLAFLASHRADAAKRRHGMEAAR